MSVVNSIGLEAEFFLTNKGGDLLFPKSSGFGCDDFIILGELRAEPGVTRAKTLANFYQEWFYLMENANKKGKLISIEPFRTVDGDFFAKILRKMGTKEISTARNIYGTDILKESDAQVSRGKVVGHNLSIGLHIHFSSFVKNETSYIVEESFNYVPVKLPIKFHGSELPEVEINLYKRTGRDEDAEHTVSSSVSRITKPVLEKIVKEFDEKILPDYTPKKRLKFRNPGFYEMKNHGGFEYRSLPMSQKIFDNLYNIVDFGYNLLEDLDIC